MTDMGSAVRTRLRELAAEEVRVHLARRRMSAAELARRAGMKQSTLARRMTGETAFDLDDLERIADVLGVTVTDLLPADKVRPNNRSAVLADRASRAGRSPQPRPTSRPRADVTRPASPVPPMRRRPTAIHPTAGPMAA